MTTRDGLRHLLGGCLETIRTRLAARVAFVVLLGVSQRRLAAEALRRVRLLQTRIQADALIEHETFSVVMRAATVLEVFQDATVELKNFLEALTFHERPGLLATNAAGAKHHDGLLLQFRRKFRDSGGKIAERIHADGQRVLERAKLDLVIVPRIEQRDRATFIQPLFEFYGGKFRRTAERGVDAFDAERDDFFLHPHEHSTKRLMIGQAHFHLQIRESRHAAKFGQQQINFLLLTCDEEIDAFDA